jgi:hypothetical protein
VPSGRAGAANDLHSKLETLGELENGEQPHAGRGELDGQWKSVEASADVSNCGRVRLRECEIVTHRLRALDEELPPLTGSARLIGSPAITRIERNFDAAAIRRLTESSRSDITIGGAELAGQAIAEGLVDECHLFLGPS